MYFTQINPINESYQLALAAAMQSSKSCTSQAESLVHELESLQSKYDRAVEERKGFIALQGDHIRTLIASGDKYSCGEKEYAYDCGFKC